MKIWYSFINMLSSIGGRYLLWRDGHKYNMYNFPNEQSLRNHIRMGFDDYIHHVVEEHPKIQEDPVLGGMLLQGAIGAYYQSLKEQETLSSIASITGADYEKLIEEECKRALEKYLGNQTR